MFSATSAAYQRIHLIRVCRGFVRRRHRSRLPRLQILEVAMSGMRSERQKRVQFTFEELESRLLLSSIPLTVEITKFETFPDNNPDTGGGGNFFAEITIRQMINGELKSQTLEGGRTNIKDSGSGDFDLAPGEWKLDGHIDTTQGPAQIVIHIVDHDPPTLGENLDDEMDVSPVPGMRGELVINVNPRTFELTNADEGTLFPSRERYASSQGIDPTFGFFSGGQDPDPNQGMVFFKLHLGGGTEDNDNDHDGLPDLWETWGIKIDPTSRLPLTTVDLTTGPDLTRPDLRLPGANPDHKDLYVEVDAVQGMAPQPQALIDVRNTFAAVPNLLINNPDNQAGISLHFEEGATPGDLVDETIQRPLLNGNPWTWTVDVTPTGPFPTEFDTIKNNRSPTIAGGFGTSSERGSLNAANILEAKRYAYRYAIFADQLDNGSSGISEYVPKSPDPANPNLPWNLLGQGTNDFVVTLGGFAIPATTNIKDVQAGTFMHELGHTLGLGHGGVDDINYKPNYHSVMNYIWQVPFPGWGPWTLDYSRVAFNVLEEGQINAGGIIALQGGIGGDSNTNVPIGPILNAAGVPQRLSFVPEGGAVNWTVDGRGTPTLGGMVFRDISFQDDTNGDGTITAADASPGQTLRPSVDWSHIHYNLRESAANFADGVHIAEANELTLEAFIRANDITAPQSALTIGSPQYPVGAAQPFVTGSTAFSIDATDDASGVHSVWYRYFLQGSTAPEFTRVDGATALFTLIGADGLYQVETYALDNAGNQETAHVQLVYLDTTAPVITINQPAATEYAHSAILTLDYTVDDGAGSGVKSVTPTLDGATTLAGHGLESGQIIQALTELSLGTHVFAINASDNLLNSGGKIVTFEVVVTPESIKEDVNFFLAQGDIKNNGLANSLLAKLNSAANAIERGQGHTAINVYEAFINELNAQSGKGVDATAAAIMIADAQYLIAHVDRFLPLAVNSVASFAGAPPSVQADKSSSPTSAGFISTAHNTLQWSINEWTNTAATVPSDVADDDADPRWGKTKGPKTKISG
jgi:FIMAH domain